MDIDESAGPYRGFLRSGSYPALTKRIVNSGGVLVRAAGWFALIVTAASAGYNMTQRLVSQSATEMRAQLASSAVAHPEPAADPQLQPSAAEPHADAPALEHRDTRAAVEASAQRASTVALPAEKVAKRKQSGNGAIATLTHPQHTLMAAETADVEASASQDTSAQTTRIAERVRALDSNVHGADTAPGLTNKASATDTAVAPPAAVSGEAPPAASAVPPNLTAFVAKPAPALVRAPAPPPPSAAKEKPAPAAPLPLAATARIDGLAVNGSVSSANVRHGIERVQPTLSECYAHAARRAGENRFSQVRVVVQIDEAGRVKRQPTIEGAQLPGLEACLSSAFSKLVCRAPDTGTAKASMTVRFGPLALAATLRQ